MGSYDHWKTTDPQDEWLGPDLDELQREDELAREESLAQQQDRERNQ